MRKEQLLIIFMSVLTIQGDDFQAHDCSSPINMEYISHSKCRIPTNTVLQKTQIIVQETTVSDVDGYECSISLTTIISFCGAYSHTKETGESTFSIPQKVSPGLCRDMVSNQAFFSETNSFPLKMNAITSFNFFTHGSISYTGNNIACVGEPLRMQNGKVNQNMLKSLHYTVAIHTIHLTAMNGVIVYPQSQTTLAADDASHGYFQSTTVIWELIDQDRCDLLKVAEIDLSSVENKQWFSDAHKIQLEEGSTFHHSKCGIMVTQTDQTGIFLVSLSQDLKELHLIDSENINPNANYISQLAYLNSKLTRSLQSSFKSVIHPTCSAISSSPTATTVWLSGSTFVRNLGDCSVSFQCRPVTVVPRVNLTKCYTRLPVQDISGNAWHLDPNTRILMEYAAPSLCHVSLLPTYRTNSDDIVLYNPDRKIIKIDPPVEVINEDSKFENGLYSSEMVSEWFSMSYLQHFAQHSYSVILDSLCGDNCKPTDQPSGPISYVQSQLRKIPNVPVPTLWFGLDIDYIGNRCSIVVVLVMLVNLLYNITAMVLRCCIFQRGDAKPTTSLARACCSDLFLISKAVNDDTVSGNV